MARKRKQGTKPGSSRQRRFSHEVKLRAVKLFVEEGYTAAAVVEELGVGHSTLTAWAKRYREEGEGGLAPRAPGGGHAQVDPAAKAKAIELKRRHPEHGSRRISQILRRVFFLKAGPETVRKTLREEGLIEAPKRKPRRNPSRPRFFERSRPNQMWQSDIFTFRLGGRTAYVIGYLDDYSRYITGAGLFRSQTAEHVLEVYRRAVGEYGVPKEMLTDNGRQYTNWRGTTRFEAELQKDRVAHIKSRPHHPMTLGKIERFWKTIWTEFLCRVQFDSFEEARERLGLWVKYYNHKRPHQGIGGLCPADRFYEIQEALREVIERGIAENVLERALRGQPRKPFYMVGRMGEQSVVIRAEKGKVKMLVEGRSPAPNRSWSTMSTNAKAKTTGSAKERRAFPARVKCEAVLSVWAERRRPLEVCRELGIPWQQLQRLAAFGDGGDDGGAGASHATAAGPQARRWERGSRICWRRRSAGRTGPRGWTSAWKASRSSRSRRRRKTTTPTDRGSGPTGGVAAAAGGGGRCGTAAGLRGASRARRWRWLVGNPKRRPAGGPR